MKLKDAGRLRRGQKQGYQRQAGDFRERLLQASLLYQRSNGKRGKKAGGLCHRHNAVVVLLERGTMEKGKGKKGTNNGKGKRAWSEVFNNQEEPRIDHCSSSSLLHRNDWKDNERRARWSQAGRILH